MLCLFCHTQNASTAKACYTCGSPLQLSAPPPTRFQSVGESGTRQNQTPTPSAPQPPAPPVTVPQRPAAMPTAQADAGPIVRAKPTLRQKLRGHDKEVTGLAFGGAALVSGSADGTVRVWDTVNEKTLHTFKPSPKQVSSVRAAAGQVGLWQTPPPQLGPVSAVAVTHDGKMIAAGHEDGQLRLWDVPGSGTSCKLEGHFSRVSALMFTADKQRLISGSSDGTVGLWNIETAKLIRNLASGSEGITALALSHDDTLLAIASDDGTIRVCDPRAANDLWSQQGHDFWTTALAFAPNGNALASGGYDQITRIWAAQTGFKLQTLTGHSGGIGAVAFAPISSKAPNPAGGRLLASSSRDGTIRLWDSWTGAFLHELTGHETPVEALAFAPDDHTLAAAARDEIWLWNV